MTSSLIQEIFQEMETTQECSGGGGCACQQCSQHRQTAVAVFRVGVPQRQIASESAFESVTDKILHCLRLIKGVTVASAENAKEITLELQYDILANKVAGDRFKNQIGLTLRNCLASTGLQNITVRVEKDRKGGKISETVPRQGTRFIDIRVLNGKNVIANIETKKGSSRYLPSQRKKDLQLNRMGRGRTFVVRKPAGKVKELSLADELLQELEIPYYG
jgi:hypothetical protein